MEFSLRIVIDIECNSLVKPTSIWLVCCKDIDTNVVTKFREVTRDVQEARRLHEFLSRVSLLVGHNILGYDIPVMYDLLPQLRDLDLHLHCVDTLVISKLLDYSRPGGHSIESYGEEFGLEKLQFSDWTKLSPEMEVYCERDVDISGLVYHKYRRYIDDPEWICAISLEHQFQMVVNALHNSGFSFDVRGATGLLAKVTNELSQLDVKIIEEFPPKLKLVKVVEPRRTKYGTLNKSDFRWVRDNSLVDYNGGPFCRCTWIDFNPSSHKQIVTTLNASGWSPVDKTQTYIDTEREINRLKYQHSTPELDIQLQELYDKIELLKVFGWKINNNNLETLPPNAPAPARTLAKRILLESRRRTLTEWLGLVQPDGRIHGSFYGIGAWTHRMAHQRPNTSNIPTDAKLYGLEMRSLWRAPDNRLLVGVDAEGIQLRIFAHYIDDREFTDALVKGRKEDKTDPHSLNQRILGSVCKSRQEAKRFVYALLLGAGLGKLCQILGCGEEEARAALARLLDRYSGFAFLKERVIPADARRGKFRGLDGRMVVIPGSTVGQRKHLCMSGYLQNGEAVIMKRACLKWHHKLKDYDSCLVNFVHDEWQTETPDNMEIALAVAKMQADSLREVGEELKLKCPLAGSYWNEDRKGYTIGRNWSVTH